MKKIGIMQPYFLPYIGYWQLISAVDEFVIYDNIQYTKTKKFKLPIYEKLGVTLICTYEKTDTADIEAVLDRKLNKNYIKENTINFNTEKEQTNEMDTIPF